MSWFGNRREGARAPSHPPAILPPQERFIGGLHPVNTPPAYYDVAAEGIPLNHQGKTSWMLLGLRLFCRWLSGERERKFREYELQSVMLERQHAIEMERLHQRTAHLKLKYEAMVRRSEVRTRQQSADVRRMMAEMLRTKA